MAFLITPGQRGDAPQLVPVLERLSVPRLTIGRPRTRPDYLSPDHLSGDKAYSSRRNRRYLRGRQIKHTIAEPRSQRANRQRRGRRGGRPVGFDRAVYKHRNEVERTSNSLKNSRAVAARYNKRADVFHGTVALATIRLWLRPSSAAQAQPSRRIRYVPAFLRLCIPESLRPFVVGVRPGSFDGAFQRVEQPCVQGAEGGGIPGHLAHQPPIAANARVA